MARSNISGNPSDPRHGTSNGFNNLSCRCANCRAAWAVEKAAYMHSHPEQRAAHAARQRAAHALRRKNYDKRRKEQK